MCVTLLVSFSVKAFMSFSVSPDHLCVYEPCSCPSLPEHKLDVAENIMMCSCFPVCISSCLGDNMNLQLTFWEVVLCVVTPSPFNWCFPVEVTSENNSEGNLSPITEDVYYGKVARHRTWSSRRHMGGTRSPHGMCLQSCF